MPKAKTRKGALKRFRVSATGKIIRRKAGKSDLQSHKSGKRKRQLRQVVAQTDKVPKKIVKKALTV